MKVRVRLAGHLHRYTGSREVLVQVEEGATARDLIAVLAIPRGEVGSHYIDGSGATGEAILRDGCLVELFPPIAGGSYMSTGRSNAAAKASDRSSTPWAQARSCQFRKAALS